ncbi:AbrB/MazE/SpoVT family DNA-binding domain-containing protein [Lactiplantibacillus mudanjiangensis]|uniref:SpoVT-AbrB domain-containing protein n=1 Tax=Lactiplantibacillus mudanjiangensis TaxID=1296538 RepID=A0A660E619_9LACO|nr:AbrB/MazE/SpoVT family DNA-binding domain-containing protein [Lactiplantibacillus mudanjiangensis]VDG23148.1 hypothetical protein [Lactobacillus koreensis] [Lactiplantibacillus mudanjiangensis]VDG29597.1 hypothetical protein [Lactobacillus koreensis] [Lactiplantibacillus mudanjiangensis]VDG32712.1 hypothetical protein [Lactobacillus koreensis] [Lactiplantibacillus mudanjiangensis]
MENTKEEIRSAIRVGNSIGFTIPADMAKSLSIEKGSRLEVKLENGGLSVKKKNDVTQDFMNDLNDTISEYHEALEILRKSDE